MRLLFLGAAALILFGTAYLAYRAFTVFWGEYKDFRPAREKPVAPARPGAPSLQEIAFLAAPGLEIKGWSIPSTNGVVVVYVHGSPGDRRSLLPLADTLHRAGYGAVLLDLPGHGESGGLATWDENALNAVREGIRAALRQGAVRAVAVVGYSMGSILAVRVAVQEPDVRAVVLLSPFTSLADQLRYQFRHRVPVMGEFAVLAARVAGVPVEQMRSIDAIRRLNGRAVMIVAGDADGAIHISMPRELYSAAREPKRLWIVEGAGHADAREVAGGIAFDERIRAFLDEAMSGELTGAAAR